MSMTKKKRVMLAPADMQHDHGIGTVDFHIERESYVDKKDKKENEVTYLRPVYRNNALSFF